MRHRKSFSCALAALLMIVLCQAAAALPPDLADTSYIAEQLSKAVQMYGMGNFDEGLTITTGLLDGADLSAKDQVAIYSVLSMLTYAKGSKYHDQAYDYLRQIVKVGPCVIALPQKFWQAQLSDQYCAIAHPAGALNCNSERDPNITTIAIMEFDHAATDKETYEELGYLTTGLRFFFNSDFAQISNVKVVTREKLDYILEEVEHTQAGLIDQSTAIKVGKIMGAQYMIFGMVQQENSRHGTIGVQVINVETSEHIMSASRDGKPNFVKLQKELVKEIAEKLDMELSKETKQLIDANGTESQEAATFYSKGVFYMCEYDYAQAYEFFKAAYEADNNFTEAKEKMELYRPLAM